MKKLVKIVVHKKGSKGSRLLAKALNVSRVKTEVFVQRNTPVAISWGHSRANIINGLNTAKAVDNAADKIKTFSLLSQHGVPTVKWTTDKTVAQDWYNNGKLVVARTVIRGASGRGIVLCSQNNGQALIDAPLYTRYKQKDAEYRVHVFRGKVIDITQKRKANGLDNRTQSQRLIRSHDNGWKFCRNNMTPLTQASLNVCLEAVKALELDFGAVDIIIANDKAYVLEVNTAPGLEGSTLQSYVRAFKEYLNEQPIIVNHNARRSNVRLRS